MMPASSAEPAAPPSGRPVSRAQLAAALGISERHLYRLLAAERAGVAEWTVPPDAPEEPPHVPIGDGPAPGRYHYRLDHDGASRLPLGLLRIGTGAPAARDRVGGGRGAGPGRLEGRLTIRHYNEQIGEPPRARKPAAKFRPKRPKRSK